MAQFRDMHEYEAERVRDLWLCMCAEAGTPLPESSAKIILSNLTQYATHQMVRCFVAEEQEELIGFVTCAATGHPVMLEISGEIEEVYVRPGPDWYDVRVGLVKQAVNFLQARGVGSIHTRICTGKDCPEEQALRTFWRTIRWENDMAIYSIYSNVPGEPTLQRVWDEPQK